MRQLVRRVAVLLAVPCALGAQAAERDLDVIARDGVRLRATHYAPRSAGPAILLLHQCNMDRRSWASLGSALAARGIHALTFDYRGYGESPRPGSAAELARDIDAALATLRSQPGVDTARVSVGGASCSVENAVQLARRSGQVKALLLLSGPTSPGAIAYLRAHPDVAILGVASSSESLAVSSLRTVVATSTHTESGLRVVEARGHGTPLFDTEPGLLASVVSWLATVLR